MKSQDSLRRCPFSRMAHWPRRASSMALLQGKPSTYCYPQGLQQVLQAPAVYYRSLPMSNTSIEPTGLLHILLLGSPRQSHRIARQNGTACLTQPPTIAPDTIALLFWKHTRHSPASPKPVHLLFSPPEILFLQTRTHLTSSPSLGLWRNATNPEEVFPDHSVQNYHRDPSTPNRLLCFACLHHTQPSLNISVGCPHWDQDEISMRKWIFVCFVDCCVPGA